MKQKSIAATLLLVLAMTTFGTAPAFAEDTAQVDSQAAVSAIDNASSEHHVDTFTMSGAAVNDQGTIYIPLKNSLNILGATTTNNPDKQERKLKLTTSSGDTQLYFSEDGHSISTAANGTYYPIKNVNGTGYVPMAFIQSLTNRVVSVSGTSLMLFKVDDTTVWKPLEAYTIDDAYVKSIGDDIVETAFQYLGVPYVWGGTTPAGFDCSGFVQYVYAQNGISVPRVTYSQQAVATPVSFSDLQPGDLVFWGASAYHVGIYIGNGQYIHAPAPGQCVRVQSMSEYAFTSAGRIV